MHTEADVWRKFLWPSTIFILIEAEKNDIVGAQGNTQENVEC